MIELLEKYGFKFRGTCNCYGPKTHKYKSGEYLVYWNKAGRKFKLRQSGITIITFKNESEFEKEIAKYLSPLVQAEV